MLKNQRGGIISKILMIPVGVALMIGFFALGYYVGKYQSKSGKPDEIVLPLPEVVSKNLPKKEEFTFYKTLTDRDNKSVSIDLKPKSPAEESNTEKKSSQPEAGSDKNVQPKKEKQADLKAAKTKTAPAKEPEPKKPAIKKVAAPARPSASKIRYTLQIASYQEKGMAETDVKKMRQRGYSAFIVSSELQGKGTWYRVRLGSFSSKASAERLQKELKNKEGITPIITME